MHVSENAVKPSGNQIGRVATKESLIFHLDF